MESNTHLFYVRATDPNLVTAGSCGGVVSALFRYLLETGRIDAVFTVHPGADLYDAVPVLITDPAEVISAAGTQVTGTILISKYLQEYVSVHPEIRIAVALKGCDAMALYEMAKRGLINLDTIIMIGLTCSGTFSPVATQEMIQTAYGIDPDLVDSMDIVRGECCVSYGDKKIAIRIDRLEEQGFGRRLNCRRCEIMVPRQCDIACGRWGVVGGDSGTVTFVEICSERGRTLLADAEADGAIITRQAPNKGIKARERTEEVMIHLTREEKMRQFELLGTGRDRLNTMIEATSRCIKCYQCIEACPLCFCEDCSTKKPWLVTPGVIPPPFMFHLIRFSHIADSCINCGQCEERCPMDIPLSLFMHSLQADLQDISGFCPGVNMDMPVLAKIGDEEWEHLYPTGNMEMFQTVPRPIRPPF